MDLDEMLRGAMPRTTAGDEMVRREVVALGEAARRTVMIAGQRRRWGSRVVLGVSAGAFALGGAGAAAAASLGSFGSDPEVQQVEVLAPKGDELVEVGPTDDGAGTIYENGEFTIIKRTEPSGGVTVEIYDTQTLVAKDADE